MITASSAPQQYYNPAQKPFLYRLPLPCQSESFIHFQFQQHMPHAQLPWRGSERGSDATTPSLTTDLQRQYTSQPFHQSFVPQCQYYPFDPCQQSRILLSPNAMMQDASGTQSTPYGIRNASNSANYNPLRQSGDSCQAVPR